MFNSLKSHPRLLLFLAVFTSIMGLLSIVGVYFFYKHWYPPILVLKPEDLGTGALIETNYGNIEIQFDQNARFPVSQFTRLARTGFYNGTRIHRIVPTLLIEGGDPLTKNTDYKDLWGQGGSSAVFRNEVHTWDTMTEGTFAFTGSEAGTYGSQFFILTKDTPWMKGRHTILGKVVRGLNVVDEIKNIPTTVTNFPLKDVVIYKITIL